MLRQALDKERKLVEAAVKKPLVDYADYTEQVVLEKDEGAIEEEKYEIMFCRKAPIVYINEIRVIYSLLRISMETLRQLSQE